MGLDPSIIAGSAGSLVNAGLSALTNHMTEKWQEKMYDRQRQDALADWNRQNEYNSPTAQMERLKSAGLNPNLVYGQGAVANNASGVRSSSPGAYHPQAPQIDASGVLSQYYDIQAKKAQINNLRAQNTVLLEDAAMKKAATRSLTNKADIGEFDLGMKQTLKDTNIDFRKQQLAKLGADTQFTLDSNERQKITASYNWEKTATEILLNRARMQQSQAERSKIYEAINLMQKDGVLKDWQIKLSKNGVTPHDNLAARFIGTYLNDLINAAKQYNSVDDNTRKVIQNAIINSNPLLPKLW